MKAIKSTQKYRDWMASIKDVKTAAIVASNVEKLERGLGDVAPVGEEVSEIRVDHGPGYRVYFGELAGQVIILLAGGTKKGQQADIDDAKTMFKELKKRAAANAAARPGAKSTSKSVQR
ncbi:type II toxin-antitoxin system RelE/ParE family toxin [Pseudoduganella sp. R-34]|uniref:type II toxin-antitoxin system RelE/ParE family toxin n=1 Tax=unclassified Pseudoduganella TaxID=2637179 RepID=UPI003CE8DCDE